MKNIIKFITVFTITALIVTSCEKDEGKLPYISFKTGGDYISQDVSLPAGSSVMIGIDASKAEDRDVLVKFNISKSINGADEVNVKDIELSGADGDNYSYDFTTTAGSTAGETDKYIFTVTNRDGLINQVSLTVTVE